MSLKSRNTNHPYLPKLFSHNSKYTKKSSLLLGEILFSKEELNKRTDSLGRNINEEMKILPYSQRNKKSKVYIEQLSDRLTQRIEPKSKKMINLKECTIINSKHNIAKAQQKAIERVSSIGANNPISRNVHDELGHYTSDLDSEERKELWSKLDIKIGSYQDIINRRKKIDNKSMKIMQLLPHLNHVKTIFYTSSIMNSIRSHSKLSSLNYCTSSTFNLNSKTGGRFRNKNDNNNIETKSLINKMSSSLKELEITKRKLLEVQSDEMKTLKSIVPMKFDKNKDKRLKLKYSSIS